MSDLLNEAESISQGPTLTKTQTYNAATKISRLVDNQLAALEPVLFDKFIVKWEGITNLFIKG